jgi:hypothetical protein
MRVAAWAVKGSAATAAAAIQLRNFMGVASYGYCVSLVGDTEAGCELSNENRCCLLDA